MSYRAYWDENGEETVELVEGSCFPLPDNYREREVAIAFLNMVSGVGKKEMLISRNTLHRATQSVRECTWGFGGKFKKDPRKYSSRPLGRRPPPCG
jgi:hypothetical protein